jgi:mRNA-degrading endonuclease RelE of RelBE toxin-antitoxin system
VEIVKSPLYNVQLIKRLKNIAMDTPNNARKFKKKLDKHIYDLDYMPYKFRASYYYDNENTRDLIVQGYTIPYLIDEENQKIIILDIFKWEER